MNGAGASRPARVTVATFAAGVAAACWLWLLVAAFGLTPAALARSSGFAAFLILGGALNIGRARPLLVWALGIATGAAIVIAFLPVTNPIAERWTRSTPPDAGQVGAVVVLSSGVTPDSMISGDALDRLLAGVETLRGQPGALLVTTRSEAPTARGMVSGEADQSRILHLLGDTARWISTTTVSSTRDEAVRTRELLQARGIRRIAVVTSPSHTRRACATFEAVGFEVACVPARMRGGGWAAPAGPFDRLRIAGDWVYECLGLAKYAIHGWLPP